MLAVTEINDLVNKLFNKDYSLKTSYPEARQKVDRSQGNNGSDKFKKYQEQKSPPAQTQLARIRHATKAGNMGPAIQVQKPLRS